MKKSYLTIAFALITTIISGQLTLENTYNYSTGTVKLETSGYKYFLMDVPNHQCRIYNLDHTLFKTIDCPVPADNYLADILFISETLFDTDQELELLYTYYQYVPLTNSYYYTYVSNIINEDGSLILNIPGSRFNYIYKTGETSFKLFSFCYDYSVFPEIIWTNIYALPGVPLLADGNLPEESGIYLNAYPNPSASVIRLDYELPSNVTGAKMNIIDNMGRSVRQIRIDNYSDHVLTDVNSLPPGVYFYNLEFGNKRTASKKIIVR